jgi:tRNA nucleotidyltransferase (CCA-adding enzyme)
VSVPSGTTSPPDPRAEEVFEALREQPGGAELLALAGEVEDLALVGGAVRDLLLGDRPRELDVVSGEDAAVLAGRLAAMLGGEATGQAGGGPGAEAREEVHERFGTAAVSWPGGRVDIARRRSESYPAPGALPEVRPGSVDEDLRRRDFTVNAIAVPLGPRAPRVLVAAGHALEDLEGRRLRALHEQSFVEDPTRLLRLARYRARLGFTIEAQTARLAAEAVAGGALDTVSGARVGAELRLALAEPDVAGTLVALDELGLLRAIDPGLELDAGLVARALALIPPGEPCRETVALAALLHGSRGESGRAELVALLDRLGFPAGVRDAAVRAALGAAQRLAALEQDGARPSQLRHLFAREPLACAVLAAALAPEWGTAAAALGAWLGELRGVDLAIDGSDLIAAGLAPGPELGRRLEAVLDARLDGRLGDGREEQLRAALGEQA